MSLRRGGSKSGVWNFSVWMLEVILREQKTVHSLGAKMGKH